VNGGSLFEWINFLNYGKIRIRACRDGVPGRHDGHRDGRMAAPAHRKDIGEGMKYYFIVNPGSRTGKGMGLWQQLEERIKAGNIEYEVFKTAKGGDATEFAKRICAEHPEQKRIIMVGGDGTANEIVNGLSGYENFELGYVPTGSSNDLARGFGITQDSAAALDKVLASNTTREVDHGIVEFVEGGADAAFRKFAVSSGVGYDADICYEALNSSLKSFLNKIGLGKLIYYILGIKLIFTNKRAAVKVTVDGGKPVTYKKLLFAAAMNTQYEGGGMPMGPGADPTDGKVTVCVVHDISRIKHMLLMSSILKGKHIRHKGVELITCKSMEIEADRPLVVHTDGEFAGKHRVVRFSCVPEKVKMLV
jgi:YegS/Rv2252/BmrU family lipid kinase